MGSTSFTGVGLALLPFILILLIHFWLQGLGRQPKKTTSNNGHSLGQDVPMLATIPHGQHHVSRREISDSALKVLYRLKDAGYEAYLVGGCVRDLQLGKHPKDFDIATEAHPEQVHELFRNSRLIGRRFKLVHVRFGREIIEVATFRASHDSNSAVTGQHGKQSDSGLILRDNVYGTVEDDAIRRDFTVNALYYSITDKGITDFVDGWEDLNQRTLRLIGDPEARYREDPVRMLRAVRFAAKLDFTLAPSTEAPIIQLADLLCDIPPARLFEEVLKLFLSGHAEQTFKLLQEFDLFAPLFPATARCLEDQQREPEGASHVEELIIQALRNTDSRIQQGKSVTPAFLFAALLWYPLQYRARQLEKNLPPLPALQQAAQDVISEQVKAISIPRRFSIPMREIWELQPRLPRRFGKRAEQLLEHPRFRASYDFLLMREASGEQLDNLGEWWTHFQDAHPNVRNDMSNALNSEKPRRKRKRKPRKVARHE